MERRDVIVVGGGHNGLTAAAVLARAGLDVLVLERAAAPGGALRDCAYALHLLHPEVVDAIGLQVPPLAPAPARVGLMPDGEVVRDEAAAWSRWWEEAARALDPFSPPAAEARGPSIVELVEELVEGATARAFHAPLYFDGDPHAPGGAMRYTWLERGRVLPDALQGVCDMGALADAFADAAARAGAELRPATPVARIGERRVELEDSRGLAARAIVSNADPAATARLRGLRPPAVGPGPGSLKLWLDGADAVEELLVVYSSTDWYRAPSLPYVEIQPGGTAYAPWVPPGVPREVLRQRSLELVRRALPEAEVRRLDTPADLEARVGLTGGAIHHLPVDRTLPGPETDVPWLWLCGAGTHPGGEVSGVPGLNAARRLLDAL